ERSVTTLEAPIRIYAMDIMLEPRVVTLPDAATATSIWRLENNATLLMVTTPLLVTAGTPARAVAAFSPAAMATLICRQAKNANSILIVILQLGLSAILLRANALFLPER